MCLLTVTTCPLLSSPSGGSVYTTDGRAFSSHAIYSCHEGYQLNGTGVRACQRSRQWTGTEPTCQRKYSSSKYASLLEGSLPMTTMCNERHAFIFSFLRKFKEIFCCLIIFKSISLDLETLTFQKPAFSV